MATKNFLDLIGLTAYDELLKDYIDEKSNEVSITPSLPRGTKIADYEINGVGSELLAPIKSLTQDEYDALPSSKNSDGIVYFITESDILDPNYSYHTWGDNDEIVVRVYHEGQADEEIRWYFHNYIALGIVDGRAYIPEELKPYWNGTTQSAKMYQTNTSANRGWIVISDYMDGSINQYESGYYYLDAIQCDGMIIMGNGAEQDTTYSDPYVWIVGGSHKIILNGVDYLLDAGSDKISYDTTANWNSHSELVSVAGHIYVYSDYQTDGDNNNIPGIKIGDGNAYLIDLPFTDALYKEHIEDTVSHITSAERTAWNNKVTCYISSTDPTNLIFTKDNIT